MLGISALSVQQVSLRDVTCISCFHWKLKSNVMEWQKHACFWTKYLSGFSPDLAAFDSGSGEFTLLSGSSTPTHWVLVPLAQHLQQSGCITFYLDSHLGSLFAKSNDSHHLLLAPMCLPVQCHFLF